MNSLSPPDDQAVGDLLAADADEPRLRSAVDGVLSQAAGLFDVVVVGGGLAGSAAAVVLGRAGYDVALVDPHEVCPQQFRVEKFGGEQADAFRRLKLFPPIAAQATAFETVVNVRGGKVVDHTHSEYYGLRYDTLVRAVRDQLPESVRFIADTVVDLRTGPELQGVKLAEGPELTARLVVVATGLADSIAQKAGISRRTTSAKHSVTYGFDLTPAGGGRFRREALTYYGRGPVDRVDYLTLFPIGEVLRANLFTFLDETDRRFREFRSDPKAALLRDMPDIAEWLGDFDISGPASRWVQSLTEIEHHDRPGVVVVGDAFRTSCPAAGIGVWRLLGDIERLCAVHAPQWLGSRGMGADKIAGYYADPVKQNSDQRALKLSRARRAVTLGRGPYWAARRGQHFLRRRISEHLRPA